MKIADIRIGERHRKDLGDLEALAKSIETEGLLQPVGITATGELVFGERRLKACALLGWHEISTRIVNVTSIAAGEYAENEMRKDFTLSERVAIADAVNAALGDRNGQRTDLEPSFHENQVRGRTDHIAAKRAGLGSASTLYNAKKVVRTGVPELVEAMDRGDVGVTAAGYVSELPAAEQHEVLRAGPKAASAVFRAARASGRKPRQGGKAPEENGYSSGVRRFQRKPATEIRDRTMGMLSTVGSTLAGLEGEALDAPVEMLTRWVGVLREATPSIRRFLSACEAHLKVETKSA